uniref:Uncharacterized protein LOC100371272 n=1 Tax=Saccoglossus kowalevskii TaxID=10224 RepID=A0ABM0MHG1_SACKO|nr:PREDICTED: uncharacterized protein LOC100371272 [Saccoglossus kowalevskii]
MLRDMNLRRRVLGIMNTRVRTRHYLSRFCVAALSIFVLLFLFEYASDSKLKTSDRYAVNNMNKLMGNVARKLDLHKQETNNMVRCYNDICDPEKTVSMANIHDSTGTLEWQEFPSIAKLQDFIKDLTSGKSKVKHYGFVFIKCRKLSSDSSEVDDEKSQYAGYDYESDETYEDDMFIGGKMNQIGHYAHQLLILPQHVNKPRVAPTDKKININMIMLDSISRHHFFRSLPKTIEKFQQINTHKHAVVFDYKLLQSLKGRTYENLQAFFSGEIYDVEKPFGILDLPPKALNTGAMLNEFRKVGYETTWIEDLCWTWEWGIVKDLLAMSKESSLAHRWRIFQHALKKAGIDRFDASLSSCEILRVNNHHDPFHGPDAVCYNGRYQHEYIFEYIEQYIKAMNETGHPYFNNILLNVAHEDSGRRVQTLDKDLSQLVDKLSKQHALTVMYADHGNAYGRYIQGTEEGRIELFNPFLFIIVPKTVSNVLGPVRMNALSKNQYRLVSILDLHYMMKSLVPSKKQTQVENVNKKYSVQRDGLLSLISVNRSCYDIPRIQPNLCICQGFDSWVKNDSSHAIIAEFALGQINNAIQEQFTAAHPKAKTGFGSCRRLIATRFGSVRESHNEDNLVRTKMDLYIPAGENSGNTEDVFFVTVETVMNQHHRMKLLSYERVSSYSQYDNCADDGVSTKLCICSLKQPRQPVKLNQSPAWDRMPPVLSTENAVKNIHNNCVYLIERQNKAGSVLEMANVCKENKYNVTINIDYAHMIASHDLPIQSDLLPGQCKFIVALVQTKTHHNWEYSYHVSFSWEEV